MSKFRPMTRDTRHTHYAVAARLAKKNGSGQLRDAIFGGIDGTVTTFAIVAGVQGAGLPGAIVVALGLANVFADGFSMAAANYAGTKAVADDRRRLWAIQERLIRTNRANERMALDQILGHMGLHGTALQQAGAMISQDTDRWITLVLAEEYGLPVTNQRPVQAALVIFAAFIAAGALPLLPYLLGLTPAFSWSIAIAGLTFFGIGAIKSCWSLAAWWRSGLETLFIGGTAAILAFWVGSIFHP